MKEKSNSHIASSIYIATLVGLVILWFTLYHDALISAAKVWRSSETYKHCFLILPGAIYLIWLRRFDITTSKIKPEYLALLPLLGASAIGLLGNAGDIQLFTHFAAFSSIPLCIWLCLGNQASLKILFPLFFIMASIPVGEELVPVLQEVTADLAMVLLKLTGLPVFRNGLYIEIPAGRFVVAEACSGIRFFISTIVFAAIYAYLSFRSVKRQLIFFIIAALIPILANAIRVFGLIMIGHFFGMEHASGTDHLVYGWVFFCVVLMLLFGFGELFSKISNNRAKPKVFSSLENKPVLNFTQILTFAKQGLFVSFAILISVQLWVLYISSDATPKKQKLNAIKLAPPTNSSARSTSWSPIYNDASDHGKWQFDHNDQSIDVFVAWYPSSSPEHELISSKNRLFDPQNWSIVDSSHVFLHHSNTSFKANVTVITNPLGLKRAVIHWYNLEGQSFTGASKTKIIQAIKKIYGGSDSGAFIAFSGLIKEDNDDTIHTLSKAIELNLDEIMKSLPSATQ